MKIPKFKKYFATTNDMNSKQKEFYDYWLFSWKKGEKVLVKGNISYIFCYIYDILRLPFETEPSKSKVGSGLAIVINVMYDGKSAPKGLKKNYETEVKRVINELKKIIKKYPEEEKLLFCCKLWLSDCYILLKNYKQAMKSAPELKVKSQSEMLTERLLSLKLKLGKRLSGKDILTLNGPKVTSFGKRNLNRILEYLNAQINSEEKREKINLLKQWKKGTPQSDYSIFLGTSSSFNLRNACARSVHLNKILSKIID